MRIEIEQPDHDELEEAGVFDCLCGNTTKINSTGISKKPSIAILLRV